MNRIVWKEETMIQYLANSLMYSVKQIARFHEVKHSHTCTHAPSEVVHAHSGICKKMAAEQRIVEKVNVLKHCTKRKRTIRHAHSITHSYLNIVYWRRLHRWFLTFCWEYVKLSVQTFRESDFLIPFSSSPRSTVLICVFRSHCFPAVGQMQKRPLCGLMHNWF